ncbi:MAG: hypothetical protein R3Y58_08520 [Eubacteriales bacterium]
MKERLAYEFSIASKDEVGVVSKEPKEIGAFSRFQALGSSSVK